MNRNIITSSDITAFEKAAATADPALLPKSFAADPPAGTPAPGAPPAAGAAADGTPPAKPAVPTQDDFLTKLLKYVPPEILGIYLFVQGIVQTNVKGAQALGIWLLVVLLVLAAVMIPYDLIVLGIVRPAQIVMSVVGFGVYVFSLGGWFATTSWYEQWYASIALPAFALVVGLLRLKPLPTTGS